MRADTMSISHRDQVRQPDVAVVRAITASSGYFSQEEERLAGSLVLERLFKGLESGYHFLFAERAGQGGQADTFAFACYGPVPCTQGAWELYWIAVRQDMRGHGHGGELVARAAERMAALGGRRCLAETSARAQYAPTWRFYEAAGFTPVATVPDYWAEGEDNLIYMLRLGREEKTP